MRIARRVFFVSSGLLMLVLLLYFVSRFTDPIVNYYGVRMPDSQFHSFVLAHPPADPAAGLYCYAEPLTDIHEQSICFDSKAELDLFLQRKHEIESQLRG